ncbi:MAG TPA: choice-of-anchor Q domain-containing protein, partial [Candidatus Dormibacteraeota bacterium]|nr:choice-of-anchor Q domain-containing protein [Candidatus Dormibacteraeota bacterium]
VVNSNGATITRGGAKPLRMFHVQRGGNLTLQNVTVTNGLTVNNVGGAGVFNDLGKLTITASTISGNKATATTASLTGKGTDATGGGIATTGTTTITNSVVTGNRALSASAKAGNTTIGEPFATGGGIAAKGGVLKVVNSTISQNAALATGTGGRTALATGAGISAIGNTEVSANLNVTVTGSTVSGNRTFATSTGGTANSAVALGGGITQVHQGVGQDSLAVINSTITSNTADSLSGGVSTSAGGAILEFGTKGDTLSVINSTIAGNKTTGNPKFSGAVQSTSTGATSTMTNTIIASNIGANCNGTLVDGGSNISFPASDTSCTATFSHGNPLLGPLQDNGGPTQTMALGTGSAAIDTAFAIVCGQAQPAGAGGVDQRGLPRMEVVADPKCDIGAFEVQPVVAAVQPATPTLPKAGTPGSGGTQGLPWPLLVPVAAAAAGALAGAARRLRGDPRS